VEVNALIVESGTVDSKCETSTAADKSGEKNAAEKMVKMGIGGLFAAVVGAAVMVV
jgi:hypothetical protein